MTAAPPPAQASPLLRIFRSLRARWDALSPVGRCRFWLLLATLGALLLCRELDHPWERPVTKETGLTEKYQWSDFSTFWQLSTKSSQDRGRLSFDSLVQIWSWVSAAWVVLALALATLTVSWWLPKAGGREPLPAWESRSPGLSGWRAAALLGGILLVALAFRLPLMNRALLFDEQDSLRKNIVGYHEVTHVDDAKGEWFPADFKEALFENRFTNNPVAFSLLAKGSLAAWRAVTGEDRDAYDVFPLRLPSLLTGLASIAMLWLVGRRLGGTALGTLAALFAAIHPFHVEYSVQARGYGVMLFAVTLAYYGALRFLEDGRWRWAAATAGGVFLVLYSYIGAFHFALLFHLCLAGLLAWQAWKGRAGARARTMRYLVMTVASACLFIALMLPTLPQAWSHFGVTFEKIRLGAEWYFLAWNHYAVGLDYPEGKLFRELRAGSVPLAPVLGGRFWSETGLGALLSLVIVPVLLLAGCWKAWRLGRGKALLVIAGLLSPLLALGHQWHSGLYYYVWYVIYVMPPLFLLLAWGIQAFTAHLSLPARRPMELGLGVALAALLAWLGHFSTAPGKINHANGWGSHDGDPAFVCRRGTALWVTYENGPILRVKNQFPKTGTRAGRDENPAPQPPARP